VAQRFAAFVASTVIVAVWSPKASPEVSMETPTAVLVVVEPASGAS